jgi:hypothetical protein
MSIKTIVTLCILLFVITGCTVKSPVYKIDNNLANSLNDYNLNSSAVSKDEGEVLNKSMNELSLRAATMISSYGNSYSDYVFNSLRQQLSQNNLYNPNSDIMIKTKLLKNNVDIWGFSVGNYDLIVNFKIFKNNIVLYDKNIESNHSFPSHFIGNIAIENAINNYPLAVQKVIAKFLIDSETIKILEK